MDASLASVRGEQEAALQVTLTKMPSLSVSLTHTHTHTRKGTELPTSPGPHGGGGGVGGWGLETPPVMNTAVSNNGKTAAH